MDVKAFDKQNKQFRLNYPRIGLHLDYGEWLDAPFKALIGQGSRGVLLGDIDITDEYICLGKTLIHKAWGKSVSYLDKKLSGEKLYIEKSGNDEVLPINAEDYHVGENAIKSKGFKKVGNTYVSKTDSRKILFEVSYNSELDVNEVYQNSFRYVFNKTANMYMIVDEETARTKFSKGQTRIAIAREFGDVTERVADYARLTYFLFKKVESLMSTEERVACRGILENTPSLEKLKDLVELESSLIERVREIKES